MSEIRYIPPEPAIRPKPPGKRKKRTKLNGSTPPKQSVKRKNHSLKRSRALRRKSFRFEPFDYEHIPYVWAAYKRGHLKEIGDIPEDMDAPAFSAWFVDWFLKTGFEGVTLIADTPKHGEIPVGLVFIQYAGQIAFPHSAWFVEASPRNKVEIGVAFFVELKKKYDVLVTAMPEDVRYFKHMADYGILRKVGLLKDWLNGENATLFHSVGH